MDRVFKVLVVIWVAYISFVIGFGYAWAINRQVVEVVTVDNGILSHIEPVQEPLRVDSALCTSRGLKWHTDGVCSSMSWLEN